MNPQTNEVDLQTKVDAITRAYYTLIINKVDLGLDQYHTDVWCIIAGLPISGERTFRNACKRLEQTGRLGPNNLTLLTDALNAWGYNDLLIMVEQYYKISTTFSHNSHAN